jgi:hypothetical protein
MGDYYNKTRGPLSVTFNNGAAAAIPPKSWLTISAANEGSNSIQQLLAKGLLIRSKMVPDPVPAVVAVVAAPVVGPSKVPVPAEDKAEDKVAKSERFGKSR